MAYPHKWSPISYKSSAEQRKHIGQRPMLYCWTTQPTMGVHICRVKEQCWGGKERPIGKYRYRYLLLWAVQKQLIWSQWCLRYGLRLARGSACYMGCTLVPPGEYDWIRHVHWRCSLFSQITLTTCLVSVLCCRAWKMLSGTSLAIMSSRSVSRTSPSVVSVSSISDCGVRIATKFTSSRPTHLTLRWWSRAVSPSVSH